MQEVLSNVNVVLNVNDWDYYDKLITLDEWEMRFTVWLEKKLQDMVD